MGASGIRLPEPVRSEYSTTVNDSDGKKELQGHHSKQDVLSVLEQGQGGPPNKEVPLALDQDGPPKHKVSSTSEQGSPTQQVVPSAPEQGKPPKKLASSALEQDSPLEPVPSADTTSGVAIVSGSPLKVYKVTMQPKDLDVGI